MKMYVHVCKCMKMHVYVKSYAKSYDSDKYENAHGFRDNAKYKDALFKKAPYR